MHTGTTLRATDPHVADATSRDIIDMLFSTIGTVRDTSSRRLLHAVKTTTAA
jgi:hypothetical protein